MTSEAVQRHRDTLALMLAMLGASAWLLPACTLWFDPAASSRVAIVGGSVIGVIVVAFTWRSPSPAIAAAAGALAALCVEGLIALVAAKVGSVTAAMRIDAKISLASAIAIAAAGVLAAATAAISPVRMRGTLLAPATALISTALTLILYIVGYAAVTGLTSLDARHDVSVGLFLLVAVFATPVAAGAVTAVLVPGSRARHFLSGWLLVFGTVMIVVMIRGKQGAAPPHGRSLQDELAAMLTFVGAIGSLSVFGAAIVERISWRPERAALPAARVHGP